jgi:hypothetical protein
MKAPYLPLFLLFASGAALADDAAILKCRTLPVQAARLACYDAIRVGAAPAVAPASAPVAAAAATPAAAPASAPTPEQRFGMEQVKPAGAPRSIESSIEGTLAGWGPGTQFKLANGQVWRVADDSSAVLAPMSNPKVRIVRNFFGTTFLEVEGTNNTPKVRRVR